MKNRRARKLSITTLIPVAILAIFYLFYKSPSRNFRFLSHNNVSETVSSQTQPACNVDHVIDGDTFVCWFSEGKEEHVRLIGVDTPESSPNEKALRDSRRTEEAIETIIAKGKEATSFAENYIKPGIEVKLELDVELRDKYDRLLAYVYLPDGTMFNALLVKEGYAQMLTIPPNVKHQDLFLKLQREARENNRGLWGEH